MPPLRRRSVGADDDVYLRPYAFHGAHLSPEGSHAVGDCPFCGREGKFSVDISNGLWRCFVCNAGTQAGGGNALVFVRLLYQNASTSILARPDGFLARVAEDRKLLSPDTPAAWGVCRARDGTWLIPGYGTDGRLDQVYRRVGGKLLPTPGLWPEGKSHALHMPAGDYDASCQSVYVCEGPWDGMAFWEVARGSQIAPCQVLAVPGCTTWRDEWTAFMRGKCVTLLYDSDHPREYVAGRVSRAGYDGMARIAKRLSGVAAQVRYIKWGLEGFDPSKPSGWDVRDHLSNGGTLVELLAKVEDAPREWFSATTPSVNGQAHHATSIEALPCSTFADCEEAWKEAMRWRQDMGHALAVLLAVCASTPQSGNQLFLQLIGSAGSGKTTLCDGLLVSGHCHHLEYLTGFHSGFKMRRKRGRIEEDDDKDCSLISRINGKTLVTSEADVLISSSKFQEIMSQQRRIFDGKSGATYKNTDKDTLYQGLRITWVMAGTPAMLDHDQSHLGDRFMRFILADPPETEKRAIIRSALRSERTAMLDRANGTAGSVVDSKTRRAHALTGGYVDWLRAHIEDEIAKIDIPEYAEEYCADLAELSADMRARPLMEDKRKHIYDTHDTKEIPTRLARQNIRLASCLAVVLNKSIVDTEVLRIVRRVALDTATGHSLKIAQWLCSPNGRGDGLTYQESGGLMVNLLEHWTGLRADVLQKYLAFLRKIDVLQMGHHAHMGNTYTLTDRVYELYMRVMRG